MSVEQELEEGFRDLAIFSQDRSRWKPTQNYGILQYMYHAVQKYTDSKKKTCIAVKSINNTGHPDFQGVKHYSNHSMLREVMDSLKG